MSSQGHRTREGRLPRSFQATRSGRTVATERRNWVNGRYWQSPPKTFTAPSLNGLIALAYQGVNTASAAINQMLSALESQLNSGPLADFNDGTVDADGFVAEVQSLVLSFDQNVDQQLSPAFPNVDAMLQLQGQRIVAEIVSLNQQNFVGLLSDSDLATQAQTAIDSLTGGPIRSLGTLSSTYVSITQTFESNLNTLAQSLSDTATTPLDPFDVSMTVAAEAEAYRAAIHAALQATHPFLSDQIDQAVNALQNTALGIAQDPSSDAQTELTNAITTFDNAVLDTRGVFGPHGSFSRALASGQSPAANPTAIQAPTTLNVSGTASFGTATLTATLTDTSSGQGVADQVISFTLDGAFAGIAVTDSDGVATLTDVPTSDQPGADTGGVFASFAGDLGNRPSSASSDLTVDQIATTLSSVSGSATFGGTATLTATLTTSDTNQAIAGQTVNFTIDGTAVGTAVTNSSGVATLSGVATSDPVGTHVGAVTVSFTGSTYFLASNGSGNLNVTSTASNLGSVSGTALFGGTATLTATLTSSLTSQGISGETVSFSLDGTAVGTAVTNSSGVATLTGVATSANAGTDTGGVGASFAGNTDFAASTGSGNLVVSQAATTLGAVSGTATGGMATLVATLTSNVTSLGVSGQTVSFTLDGTAVGTAMTDNNGLATLSNVPTSDPMGTNPGAVVASYSGTSNYSAAANASGDLVVS